MTKQWRRDLRFGTWNVKSLYRAGSLTATTREFSKIKSYIWWVYRRLGGTKGAQ
jgi:hypothetical protein